MHINIARPRRHDDVIKWKHFPRYWPFVRGIPTHWPVTRSFDVFFDLCLNKRLSKQLWGWWCGTTLWRHCNGWYYVPSLRTHIVPGLNHHCTCRWHNYVKTLYDTLLTTQLTIAYSKVACLLLMLPTFLTTMVLVKMSDEISRYLEIWSTERTLGHQVFRGSWSIVRQQDE